jgi:hypothetical protein
VEEHIPENIKEAHQTNKRSFVSKNYAFSGGKAGPNQSRLATLPSLEAPPNFQWRKRNSGGKAMAGWPHFHHFQKLLLFPSIFISGPRH